MDVIIEIAIRILLFLVLLALVSSALYTVAWVWYNLFDITGVI